VDEGALAFMHEAFDLRTERSRIAWHDERAIGLAMLAVRGPRAWVGGMGVASEARRAGVGEQLMRALLDSAREAGVKRVQLEVLEPNTRRAALYEKLGFRTFRRLEVWRGRSRAPAPHPSRPSSRERRGGGSPRPGARPSPGSARTPPSIAWTCRRPALRALHTEGGDVVYRVTDGRASVLQLAAADCRRRARCSRRSASRPGVTMLRYLNVPDDDPAAAALRAPAPRAVRRSSRWRWSCNARATLPRRRGSSAVTGGRRTMIRWIAGVLVVGLLLLGFVTWKRSVEPARSSDAGAPVASTPATSSSGSAGRDLRDHVDGAGGWRDGGALRCGSPPTCGGPDPHLVAECAVFHFGAGQGGGVDENIDRWVGQFEGTPGSSRRALSVHGMNVTRVEIAGTFLDPGADMQSQARLGAWKLLGAIVEGPQGSVFFKFTGPAGVIDGAAHDFDALLASLEKR
jgi:hypothetical protein